MIISKNFLWSRYKYFHFLKNLNLTRSENVIVRGRPCFRQPSMAARAAGSACGLPLSAAGPVFVSLAWPRGLRDLRAGCHCPRQWQPAGQCRQIRQQCLLRQRWLGIGSGCWPWVWTIDGPGLDGKDCWSRQGGSGSHANRGKNRQRGFFGQYNKLVLY